MSFDLIEFLSKVALSLFGKEGASNASIIGLLGFIAFWNIKKHLDKKRAERKEKAKKIVSVKRMGSHEEEISVILENILKKLYSNEVVRAAVMQISNGGEFMNKVSMLKLHMTYEERVNIHIKPIRDRYNQVMINGKYDKLFKKIYISVKCLLEIAEIETMQYEFAEDRL